MISLRRETRHIFAKLAASRSRRPRFARGFAAKIIDGKKLRMSILERVGQEAALLPRAPGLTVIQVGGHADSTVYVRHKLSAAEACGMEARHIKLPRSSTQSDILATIHDVNNDPATHGVLLQLPLDTDQDVDQSACLNAIDPMKDVDGLHYINAGLLSHGEINNCLLPCTPRGCMELIKSTGQPIRGANAVVLGRSAIVGTPMSELLKWHDATVTIMHGKSQNTIETVREADIVVAACRQQEMITAEWLKPGAIVIDVGIHSIPDATKKSGYRLTGDVDFKSASQVAGWITPVPGHVGPMTVAMVVQNTLDCAKRFLLCDRQSWQLRPLTLRGGMQSINWSVSDPSMVEDLLVPFNDLQISQAAKPKNIQELCKEMHLFPIEYKMSGHFAAKLPLSLEDRLQDSTLGKYIVMSAITPTPLGEGKTTTVCGLTQALGAHLGKNVIATLRQPAQGPLFSTKGGAAGGGYSQVIPMDTFNSHLTGDFHAISTAQNLLAAAVDARIGHEASALSDDKLFASLINASDADNLSSGHFTAWQSDRLKRLGINKVRPEELDADERRRFSRLNIDQNMMNVSRVVDMNDEMLRSAVLKSRRTKRFPLKRIFENTTACELMSILALCKDIDDLQERVARMVVALDRAGNPVTAADLGAQGAVTWIMNEAIQPTLMQTLEGTPVLVHAGPYANVGTGNGSIIADRMALRLVGGDGYVVTEAGHGADIGLEKFFNIKCRTSGFWPNCVVLVATCRGLKVQGGAPSVGFNHTRVPEEWTSENLELLEKGGHNLRTQIQQTLQFGVPVVVAVNAFITDSDAELEAVRQMALDFGAADAAICRHWELGGKGAIELAQKVMEVADRPAPSPKFLYDTEASVEEKLEVLARKVYGCDSVELREQARTNLASIKRLGFANLPLCVSQSPFKPRAALQPETGEQKGVLAVRTMRLASGAGMLIVEIDKTVTMPMLPVRPLFFDINFNEGAVRGLQ